jgi:prophage regulatory protein
MTTTILRLPAVKARTGLSRSSIYLFIRQGTFPAPINLGTRAVGWDSDLIDAWISDRIRDSRKVAQDARQGLRS